MLDNSGEIPSPDEFEEFLALAITSNWVSKFVWEKRTLYSLTSAGNRYLSPKLRLLRDKLRAFLLRDAHRARLRLSRDGEVRELTGDSPVVDASSSMKGREANNSFGPRRTGQNYYWPRIQGQFSLETGPVNLSRDPFPPMLSFASMEEVTFAAHGAFRNFVFDYNTLSVCMGFSPKLLAQIANNPSRHYRQYYLPKKGGGTRKIESPRIFLKVIQWFLAEMVFSNLKISGSVHSFRTRKSIVTNALAHQNKKFVANIDIENFFGSIDKSKLIACLAENGFGRTEANFLSLFCTKEGYLPQGAPTSPALSNAVLFQFDIDMRKACIQQKLVYTRYADDITISGNDRSSIMGVIENAKFILENQYGLSLNSNKTRIASRSGQQRVTGVVVNVAASPSRAKLKKIRAAFHQAQFLSFLSKERHLQLNGYIGFLSQFPKFKESALVNRYKTVLSQISR